MSDTDQKPVRQVNSDLASDEQRAAHVQALIEERDGYANDGRSDRVKEVEKQLAAFGHSGKTPAQRATKLTKAEAEGEA